MMAEENKNDAEPETRPTRSYVKAMEQRFSKIILEQSAQRPMKSKKSVAMGNNLDEHGVTTGANMLRTSGTVTEPLSYDKATENKMEEENTDDATPKRHPRRYSVADIVKRFSDSMPEESCQAVVNKKERPIVTEKTFDENGVATFEKIPRTSGTGTEPVSYDKPTGNMSKPDGPPDWNVVSSTAGTYEIEQINDELQRLIKPTMTEENINEATPEMHSDKTSVNEQLTTISGLLTEQSTQTAVDTKDQSPVKAEKHIVTEATGANILSTSGTGTEPVSYDKTTENKMTEEDINEATPEMHSDKASVNEQVQQCSGLMSEQSSETAVDEKGQPPVKAEKPIVTEEMLDKHGTATGENILSTSGTGTEPVSYDKPTENKENQPPIKAEKPIVTEEMLDEHGVLRTSGPGTEAVSYKPTENKEQEGLIEDTSLLTKNEDEIGSEVIEEQEVLGEDTSKLTENEDEIGSDIIEEQGGMMKITCLQIEYEDEYGSDVLYENL